MTGHPPTPPKAIIFDIGHVIIRLNLKRALEALAAKPRDATGKPWVLEDLWRTIHGDARWEDWAEGRMTPREWHAHLNGRLNLGLTFEEFRAAWNAILEPETILSDRLFERLSATCRLAVLSNTDPIHVETMERSFPFLRYFPARIYSCGAGSSKPKPEIYQAALKAVNAKPAEALYIDDVEEFAQAARQQGIDAIHFQDPSQLAREFSFRGLPFES